MPDNATFTLEIDDVPAGPDLIDAIEQIEVDCALEEASALRVTFAIAKTAIGDWSVLDVNPFTPFTPVALLLGQGDMPPVTLIRSYVSEHAVSFDDGAGASTLAVTGLDATSLMNAEEKITSWPNLPDSVIAASILESYGVLPLTEATPSTLVDPEGTTIQRGTDIRFLRRLARRNGFDVYVQPQPLTGLEVGYFQPRAVSGAPDAVLSVSFGEETNVSDFRIRFDLTRPAAAEAVGLDAATNTLQPAAAPFATELPLGALPTLLGENPAPLLRPADTGLPATGELTRALQGLVNRSSWSIVAEGTVGLDVPILRPGAMINVRGCGHTHSGSYLITRVRHMIEPGGYEARFEARRNATEMTGAELYVQVPA